MMIKSVNCFQFSLGQVLRYLFPIILAFILKFKNSCSTITCSNLTGIHLCVFCFDGFFMFEIVKYPINKNEVINNTIQSKLFSIFNKFQTQTRNQKNTLTFSKRQEKWIDSSKVRCNANFSLKIKSLFFVFSFPYCFIFFDFNKYRLYDIEL
jgi:hypothetical protein